MGNIPENKAEQGEGMDIDEINVTPEQWLQFINIVGGEAATINNKFDIKGVIMHIDESKDISDQ